MIYELGRVGPLHDHIRNFEGRRHVAAVDAPFREEIALVVDERGGTPHLVALCEQRAPAASGVGQAELEGRLRNVLGVRIGVRLLPWGTVPRTEVGKAVRVVRWAGGDPPVPGLS